jgi:hypothetical protein
MVMGTGLGIGMDNHRPCPKLLRPHTSVRNRFRSGHAWGLRSVAIQLTAADNA